VNNCSEKRFRNLSSISLSSRRSIRTGKGIHDQALKLWIPFPSAALRPGMTGENDRKVGATTPPVTFGFRTAIYAP
jgi:hypothetical protein